MPFEFPGAVPIEGGDDIAQSHLDWLIDFRNALELFQDFMAMYLNDAQDVCIPAGAEGINVLKVVPDSPTSMEVSVTRGICVVDRVPYALLIDTLSPVIIAPVTNPRIDIIVANPQGKTFDVITGTEAGSPVAPTAPTGTLKLCEIDLIVSQTSIEVGDITDSRSLGG